MSLFSIKKMEEEFLKPRYEEPKGFLLFFAGAMNPQFEVDLQDKGANRLCSQLLDRNAITAWQEGRKRGTCKGNLIIDSGAFSAHTRDAEVDVDKYIDYLNEIDDDVFVCAQVDKIPGKFRQPKSRKDLEEAPELSWKKDYRWLHNILEWRGPNGEKVEYMGISPANDQPVKEKIKFIEKCFNIIKRSSNPNIKTHAFGMTSLYVLEMYPFTSADSTSWLLNGANGSIMTRYGSVTVSEKSKHLPTHIRKMPKAAQQEIQKYVESKGFTMEDLSSNYVERIRFNIEYLLDWARNYRYNPSSVKRRSLI